MTTRSPARVAIVGASAAGITAVETLRRNGFGGAITLIGEETRRPYDRPPLSKQILAGTWDADRANLRDEASLARLQIDMRLGTRAVGLDLNGRIVKLGDGGHVPYDALIIATGVIPRRLPAQRELPGVHVLRTVEDSLALRTQLREGRRLVVIGGGFLGCEVAATARSAGLQVSIVDPAPVPMFRQLGQEVGCHAAALHREHGVDVRCGVGVRRLIGGDNLTGVELATGAVLDADLVLVAIGSTPATDWLIGSGLTLNDGIVCDSRCCTAPGVYAAGDVARWWHDTLRAYLRVEHRTNATEQAITAASNVLGADTPFQSIPYFWTDQYDARIQAYGTFPPDCKVTVVRGAFKEGRFLAHYVQKDRIAGILAWNMPKELQAEREIIGKCVADFPLVG